MFAAFLIKSLTIEIDNDGFLEVESFNLIWNPGKLFLQIIESNVKWILSVTYAKI